MNIYTFIPLDETPIRMTSSKATITYDGNDYLPRTVERSPYALDSLSRKNNLKITFLGNDQFARRFLLPVKTVLKVSVAELTGEIIFRGTMISVQYDTRKNRITLIFEPSIRLDRRATGERRMYQIDCPYSLYGTNCGATDTPLTCTISALRSNRKVQIRNATTRTQISSIFRLPSGQRGSPNTLIGGTLTTAKGKWWIINVENIVSDGTAVFFDVTLFRSQSVLAVNDSCTISFGCRRIPTDCETRFNNQERYGGFLSMTKESPFEGGLS